MTPQRHIGVCLALSRQDAGDDLDIARVSVVVTREHPVASRRASDRV